MNDEEAVEPQEEVMIEQIMEDAPHPDNDVQEQIDDAVEPEVQQKQEKPMVPLSALQKARTKARELELELQWERQRAAQQQQAVPPQQDDSRYESATREDLINSQEQAIRVIEERLWIKQNPEKHEFVNEYLQQFLKQRPNLASAITQSSNRYEEAYTLMSALTPKQQQQLAKPVVKKKEAPNAPGGVPKAAALNEAVDVMSMSDNEYAAWRKTKQKRR